MKSESEKKSIVKSIKLSPSQVQQIEEKANEKNMTFSSYMVDCALHNNQGITPQIAVKYQELVNMVQEIADNINRNDYVRKEELRRKADDLCELFHSVTPIEKYENLKRKMGLFIEGGLDVWESLNDQTYRRWITVSV